MVEKFSENQSKCPVPRKVGSQRFEHGTSGDITRLFSHTSTFFVGLILAPNSNQTDSTNVVYHYRVTNFNKCHEYEYEVEKL